jgi:ADP-ribose pyrophosphatase YjhB (NUDIX family)
MVPRVGVGALIEQGGKVLLIQRRRAPEAGHWSPVGGKPEFMEPLEDALRREVLEEVGVQVRLERLLTVCDHRVPAEAQHWVSPIYLAGIVTGEPRNLEPDAIATLLWVDPLKPPTPLTITARAALDAFNALEP